MKRAAPTHFPMNARAGLLTCFLPAALALLLTAGCSLVPEAKPDPTRFYVLSTPTGAGAPAAAGAPVVHLKSVELADYLRARPLIVRRGNNEIEFREFARWGEPLELGIGRVLREELLARGAASTVLATGMRREAGVADFQLTIRVLACEGAATGAVEFRAVWEITPGAGNADGKPVARGDFRAAELRWDGKSGASLAAQLSQAVGGLAAEIAGGLKK